MSWVYLRSFLIGFVMIFSISAKAGEINYDNFQGVYRLEAKAGNRKAVLVLQIKAAQVFEVTREYEDGHLGQTCDGTYTLDHVYPNEGFGQDLVMKGNVSCPSDRQNVYQIELNMKNAQTRDLEKGTWVELYSSEARMTIQAKMKRQ